MSNTQPIRVMIADDHPIVRQGMELVLSTQPDMELVAQATDGAMAVTLALETEPDVIVMDLQMPVQDGASAIEALKQAGLETPIVVLTSFPDDELALSAIQAGATGLLIKDAPPAHLLDTIRAVERGEMVIHPSMVKRLVKELHKPDEPQFDLTPREQEVLVLISQGLTNREIAAKLSISVRTVTTHVRNILDALQLENRTQAALFALNQGLVPRTTPWS